MEIKKQQDNKKNNNNQLKVNVMTSKIGQDILNNKTSGKVIFLKHKEDIKEAFEEGWGAKDIWRSLKKNNEFTFSYQLFLRYSKKYIFIEPEPIKKNETNPNSKIVKEKNKPQSNKSIYNDSFGDRIEETTDKATSHEIAEKIRLNKDIY